MSALVLHWLAALLIVMGLLSIAAGIQEWLIWRKGKAK
jgi:hypothetical protein